MVSLAVIITLIVPEGGWDWRLSKGVRETGVAVLMDHNHDLFETEKGTGVLELGGGGDKTIRSVFHNDVQQRRKKGWGGGGAGGGGKRSVNSREC